MNKIYSISKNTFICHLEGLRYVLIILRRYELKLMRIRASKHVYIKMPFGNDTSALKECKSSWSLLYTRFKQVVLIMCVSVFLAAATMISSQYPPQLGKNRYCPDWNFYLARGISPPCTSAVSCGCSRAVLGNLVFQACKIIRARQFYTLLFTQPRTH